MKFTIVEELSTFNFGKEFADAGRSNEKKITAKDVDEKELEMGMEVEMEHTTNKDVAKKIALDHLAEIKDYYTRLKKMEDEAKKEGEKDAEKDSEEKEEKEGEDKEDKEDKDDKEDKESSMKV